jgi:23S rRNA (uracil1939-C5)-methyltransferase
VKKYGSYGASRDASSTKPSCWKSSLARHSASRREHVSIEQQRDIKSVTLRDNLERIGRVEPGRWLEPASGPEWNYRRRARLAVKDVSAKGRVLVGFRERHAPYITDMHRCEVLAPPVDGLIDALSDLIGRLSIRARLPQVEVAVADNATVLVFRVLDPPAGSDLDEFRAFGVDHGVRVYLQPGGPGSLQLLHPEALRLLEAGAEDRVLDLFCGIGNFSLPLARHCGAVLGIEGEATLVARAAHNAAANGIDNAEFRRADLAAVGGTESWLRDPCDRLLLDPARSGAAEVVNRIGRIDPERIVYVSCHPGTLARDAGMLVNEAGYTLEAAGIIDMFPHTAHVESIAVFQK